MRAADLVVAFGMAVIFAAVFATLFDLAPIIAKAMVRQAARWWHSDLDTPEELAEDWQAMIDDRPVGVLKIGTALGFWARAAFREVPFVIEQQIRKTPELSRSLARSAQHRARQTPRLVRKLTGVNEVVLAQESAHETYRFTTLGLCTILNAALTGFVIFAALRDTGTWFIVVIPLAGAWTLLTLVACRWLTASMFRPGAFWRRAVRLISRLGFSVFYATLTSQLILLAVDQPDIGGYLHWVDGEKLGQKIGLLSQLRVLDELTAYNSSVLWQRLIIGLLIFGLQTPLLLPRRGLYAVILDCMHTAEEARHAAEEELERARSRQMDAILTELLRYRRGRDDPNTPMDGGH